MLVDLWTVHWLAAHFFDPAQVFQGNIFFPARHAVLHSDLSLGTVVLLLPFRPFVKDPVPLTNLAAIAALAFGGWAFHALGRALTGDRWAGLVCGVLAAFNSHQMRHLYHLNLLSIGWLALFLLGLHRRCGSPPPEVSSSPPSASPERAVERLPRCRRPRPRRRVVAVRFRAVASARCSPGRLRRRWWNAADPAVPRPTSRRATTRACGGT